MKSNLDNKTLCRANKKNDWRMCQKDFDEATTALNNANRACIMAGASYIVLGAATTATIAYLF
jgi:hypothetical protein